MEGPKRLQAGDYPSLCALEDKVFGPDFCRRFPQLFCAQNRENLWAFRDRGEVVSHVGWLFRWFSLGGCSIRVGMVGCVATDEAYRGRGLAGRLLNAGLDDARAAGVDLVLISGSRGLYHRLGAAEVGRDSEVRVDRAAAGRLETPCFELDPMTTGDIHACRTLYENKAMFFLRPTSDWQHHLESGFGMHGWTTSYTVKRGGRVCAYLVLCFDREKNIARVVEFGGDAAAVCGVAKRTLDAHGADAILFHLQPPDAALGALLSDAGGTAVTVPAAGTLLILNPQQMMGRLRPHFARALGERKAREVAVGGEGEVVEGAVRISFGEREDFVFRSREDLALCVFGRPETPVPEGTMRRVFPIPSPWYGLNWV